MPGPGFDLIGSEETLARHCTLARILHPPRVRSPLWNPMRERPSGGSMSCTRVDFPEETRLHVENKAPHRDLFCDPRM